MRVMKTQQLKELLYDTFGHLNDRQLLGLVIYGEARGESEEGRIAVGSVILERVDHRDWDGKTIQEVCLMPYQLSCFLPGDPNFQALKLIADDWPSKVMHSLELRECYSVAACLIAGETPRTKIIADNHCCQYVTSAYRKQVKKGWWSTMKLIATIDHHEFYA